MDSLPDVFDSQAHLFLPEFSLKKEGERLKNEAFCVLAKNKFLFKKDFRLQPIKYEAHL